LYVLKSCSIFHGWYSISKALLKFSYCSSSFSDNDKACFDFDAGRILADSIFLLMSLERLALEN